MSQFRILPNLYPKLFKSPPLDDQVAVTMNHGGLSPNSDITDHRRTVEAFYAAFMSLPLFWPGT